MHTHHGTKAVLVGAQRSGDQHVAAGAHAAVGTERHTLTQPVGGQRLVHLLVRKEEGRPRKQGPISPCAGAGGQPSTSGLGLYACCALRTANPTLHLQA